MKKLTAGFAAGLCALAAGVTPAHAATSMYGEDGSYSYVARYIMMVPTDVVISVAEIFDNGSSSSEAPVEAEAPAEAETTTNATEAAEADYTAGVELSSLAEGDTFASQMVELVGKTIDNMTSSKARGGRINAVTTYDDGTVLSFTKEAGAAEYKLVGIE
ncbi:hypothetical protein H7347_08915 [Corynebacterium sp. zg-331]|uniref:hypothetical protein n=1 Tax=unclassified Corynebacterium TaxID=2624378 RepID=UPI00128E3D64|nr:MULTISPECIES: hypothetical protein [unclassified Corynebacterium]MBC3186681.1 hypothetical protein [Corynebacterium sp. zg-331]MPV53163.1 hypothetical protein [Corynebacterium sp. zg331]